jgi:predicted ATPase
MNERQISKISIDGYKSIKHCELELGMVNVLIGSNGAGKSNFISLFEFLQKIVDEELQLYVARHGGPNAMLHFGSQRTEKMGAKICFGENSYGFELMPTTDNRLVFENEWVCTPQEGKELLSKGHIESLWRKAITKNVLDNQRWRVYHFHDTSDTALVKQECGINDNAELANDGRNLAAYLYRIKTMHERNYRQIVNTVRMAAPYFADFVLQPNPYNKDRIILQWKDVNGDTPFMVSALSDGTLRFICLATLLLQPRELMPETILIDEPELGLHPYAISLLAAMIKKASVEKQIIVSTQSVEVVNEFSADDIIVVNHDIDHSSFERLEEKKLQTWLSNDYTLGELWKSNIIGGRP